jgi:hypothetical protein
LILLFLFESIAAKFSTVLSFLLRRGGRAA